MVKVTLSINEEIVKKAKQLGLNLSQCLENCLKLYIQALENANKQLISNQASQLENSQEKGRERETVGVSWCGRRDLNPGHRLGRPASYQARLRPHYQLNCYIQN